MTWREGVHITSTPIWCDARRRRDVCFVSSLADQRLGKTGHGQLIGTQITLALLGARDVGHLAVPLRQRFTLGTLRLELIPSGRGFGAAALHVDIAGKTVLYAGAVRTIAGGVGDPAEVRACDAVVVAAPYGEARHRFPPLETAIAQTLEWTRAQLAAGVWPVLFVDTTLDALEVACRLGAEGIAVAGSRALREAGQRIADLVPPPQLVDGSIAIGRTLTPRSIAARTVTPTGAKSREPAGPYSIVHGADTTADSGIPPIATLGPRTEPRAIVWLDSERAALGKAIGNRPHVTALVSARALDGAADPAAFAWANAADRAQLLGWIEATKAREVFVTGACSEAIVAALGARGKLIGPPHQMQLFPREAAR